MSQCCEREREKKEEKTQGEASKQRKRKRMNGESRARKTKKEAERRPHTQIGSRIHIERVCCLPSFPLELIFSLLPFLSCLPYRIIRRKGGAARMGLCTSTFMLLALFYLYLLPPFHLSASLFPRILVCFPLLLGIRHHQAEGEEEHGWVCAHPPSCSSLSSQRQTLHGGHGLEGESKP